ncbi:MAG: hypothetical protein Q9201_000763 [Fulgogasparrea decipioides]
MASTETLDILVVTFNCARQPIKPGFLSNAVRQSQRPTIIVLSLQEIAPIAYAFLGGSYLAPYLLRFIHAVELAAKKGLGEAEYVNVVTRNVGMTACMVFALKERESNIRWIDTGGVGLGVHEMGNKGAVGLRLGYAVSDNVMELAFIAAHLTPMEDALTKRNQDWMNIVRRLAFTPAGLTNIRKAPRGQVASGGEESEALLANHSNDTTTRPLGIFTPNIHLILAGDLNYRTSSTKPQPSDTLAFPQPTIEPTDPHHYSHLLKNDQLSRERRAGRTCHGLSEAPIHFPPTYKYSDEAQLLAEKNHDVTTWDWAMHRWPSWCDRILYLDLPEWMKGNAKVEVQKYNALPLQPTSDHRPVVLALRIPLKAIPAPEDGQGEQHVRRRPPFELDPDWRARRAVARRKEILVGVLAYLSLTWEGRGIVLALVIGTLGGWAIVRSMLEV